MCLIPSDRVFCSYTDLKYACQSMNMQRAKEECACFKINICNAIYVKLCASNLKILIAMYLKYGSGYLYKQSRCFYSLITIKHINDWGRESQYLK